MAKFFSDLKATWSPDALKRIGHKVLDDDCFGLAGQMAYFVLFSLFPFLLDFWFRVVFLAGVRVELGGRPGTPFRYCVCFHYRLSFL